MLKYDTFPVKDYIYIYIYKYILAFILLGILNWVIF